MHLVAELIDFLDGDTSPILDRLDKQMHEASDELEFERAARLRDQIVSVRKAIERQQMVDAKEEDYDAIGMVDDPLEASVQVFLVRKGRVVGRKGLVVDKVEDVGRPELVGRLLEQLYGDLEGTDIPREILVPDAPDDPELYQEFLGLQRGSKVRVRVPQRGAKRQLMETVTQNAHEAMARHKLKRASDHNARARALVALQDALQPAGSAAAHRVLRHLQPAGHRDRGVDGRDGRRPAEALRLPPVQDPPPTGPGRLRLDGGGAHASVPPLPARTATKARAAASASPTRPTSC